MKFLTTLTKFALPFVLTIAGQALAGEETNAIAPATARGFYNAGTKLLAGKKFAEAETMFQSALAVQDERVQPAALYNLGHTRFSAGVELLKKGPDAQKISAMASAAGAEGVISWTKSS